jgi:hypothetical protein
VLVTRADGAFRLSVRGEGMGDRTVLDLPGAPDALVAHPTRASVALVWVGPFSDEVWFIDVDARARWVARYPSGGAAISAWRDDAPR